MELRMFDIFTQAREMDMFNHSLIFPYENCSYLFFRSEVEINLYLIRRNLYLL